MLDWPACQYFSFSDSHWPWRITVEAEWGGDEWMPAGVGHLWVRPDLILFIIVLFLTTASLLFFLSFFIICPLLSPSLFFTLNTGDALHARKHRTQCNNNTETYCRWWRVQRWSPIICYKYETWSETNINKAKVRLKVSCCGGFTLLVLTNRPLLKC